MIDKMTDFPLTSKSPKSKRFPVINDEIVAPRNHAVLSIFSLPLTRKHFGSRLKKFGHSIRKSTVKHRFSRFPGGVYFPAGLAVGIAAVAVLALPFLDGMADARKADILAAAEIQECAAENGMLRTLRWSSTNPNVCVRQRQAVIKP